MKYQKKSVIVEAYQWEKLGDHSEDGTEEEANIVQSYMENITNPHVLSLPYSIDDTTCHKCYKPLCEHGWIKPAKWSDGCRVCPGDWIVTEDDGSVWACPNENFKEIYGKIIQMKTDQIEELQDRLHQIETWIDAYPLSVFPEPDFKEVHRVLEENGLSLDVVSASNMRHVLKEIKRIINGKTTRKK